MSRTENLTAGIVGRDGKKHNLQSGNRAAICSVYGSTTPRYGRAPMKTSGWAGWTLSKNKLPSTINYEDLRKKFKPGFKDILLLGMGGSSFARKFCG